MKDEAARFASCPLFVFAMPLSKAQQDWPGRVVGSFLSQAYPHWELHVFGADPAGLVGRSFLELAGQDPRITFTEVANERAGRGQAWSRLMRASGTFVGLIEQHVELLPDALFAVAKRVIQGPEVDAVYGDHDHIASDGEPVSPFFKPGWDPDLLLSMNYLSPFCLFRRAALLQTEGWQEVVENDGLYGLLLRFTDVPRNVSHIPQVLCHSGAGHEDEAMDGRRTETFNSEGPGIVSAALRRRKETASVNALGAGRWRLTFHPVGDPLVSIIIPTRDRGDLLERCVASIEKHSCPVRYEIIVVDNGTTDGATLRYLDALAGRHRVIRYPAAFNYSAMNNLGVKQAGGDYLLFLNNDTEVLTADWLSRMVGQAQRPGVGAVGAKLLYSDGRIQHAGVVLGVCGVAGHAFRHCPADGPLYHGLSDALRNCSAVTGACMMVAKALFEKVQGFDEQLPVEFSDVDLCLRIREQGYRIVYAPEAVLYHHENATRKERRAPQDEQRFTRRWGAVLSEGDPFYNPNLTRRREDWSLDV